MDDLNPYTRSSSLNHSEITGILAPYFRKAKQAVQLLSYFGLRLVITRLLYVIRLRTGLVERATPAYEWDQRPLNTWLKQGIPATASGYLVWRKQNQPQFLFSALPVSEQISELVVEQANALLAGHWRYFEHETHDNPIPPDWHISPIETEQWPIDLHWSQIPDFGRGDIKYVWELNRFSFVFTLARAYAKTRNEQYASTFWNLVMDWQQKNFPERGVNWKCGQETSIRLMAWCFGWYAFQHSPSSTPERVSRFAQLVAGEAERVEKNLGFAISTRSNHGISEGMGLWTVGLLFPEFARADHWRILGKNTLIHEISYQIEADGTYTMHSFNYLRSIQQTYLWCLRLGEVNEDRFPASVYDALGRSLKFILQTVDLETGEVPQHGSNDGSFLLPLTGCDFTDYRPTLQLGYTLCFQQRLFPVGCWDEALAWFWDSSPGNKIAQVTQYSSSFPSSGYYILRSPDSFAMIHAPVYHERPNQADLFHVDIWWKHLNIACDPGTFIYNAPDPWDNALAATRVHNTVTVDDLNQMTRVSHFTWLDWANTSHVRSGELFDGWAEYWEGQQNGYERLADPVRHHRALLRLGSDRWVVVDTLEGRQPHDYRLHWLLNDFPYQSDHDLRTVSLDTPEGSYNVAVGSSETLALGSSLTRADDQSTAGWRSRYYGFKEPALSYSLSVRAKTVVFWSIFGTSVCNVKLVGGSLQVESESEGWSVNIALADFRHPRYLTPCSEPRAAPTLR